VVDRDGNIASMIQSVYDYFGSGVAVKSMGFLLQDRGGLSVLDPKHPDALGPHKRPFHTIIPAFMERGDQHIGFGIMGGSNQPLAHAQFVSNVVDYSWNIQAALSPLHASPSATQESQSSAPFFWSRESCQKCRVSCARRAMTWFCERIIPH
jgi:gamma-glutamyltranspeptidase